MDLILRNAVLPDRGETLFDVGVDGGRIRAIEPGLAANGEEIDCGGRLLGPGFIETHIHLDKSGIVGRCQSDRGDLEEAIQEVAKAKKGFTAEDVYERGKRTLERCILHGTTHMRTHLEVDPGIGLRGLEGIRPLIQEYKWAIDLQICIFPQEGLTNNPGTDELIVAALKDGGSVVGAAPYADTDPHAQIDRIFEIAREFDVDIDMHLDFGPDPEDLDLLYVCELTEKFRYGGRVTIGHVTKLSNAPSEAVERAARRMAGAGVALTVLPSTDLYLMGRQQTHGHLRGVTRSHKLIHHGVNCTVSTNNVLNPFTPFGDCSLIRMANLYANVCHVGARTELRDCFDMITSRSARLMNIDDYGLEVGNPADLVVLDAPGPETAVAELSPVLYAFKNGRRTVTRAPAVLNRPGA
jgi:cytosine deaminase